MQDKQIQTRFKKEGVFKGAVWYPREDNEDKREVCAKILKVTPRGRRPIDSLIIYKEYRKKGEIDLITESGTSWFKSFYEYAKPTSPLPKGRSSRQVM